MEVVLHAQPRKLLLHTPLYDSATSPALAPVQSWTGVDTLKSDQTTFKSTPFNSLDATVIMVLSILLCGLICTLLLNAIVRCLLRITNRVCYVRDQQVQPNRPVQVRLTLPTLVYSTGLELSGDGSGCAICLSGFACGEHVRVLPKCSHGFHVRCVDRWLAARLSCPTCRQVVAVQRREDISS